MRPLSVLVLALALAGCAASGPAAFSPDGEADAIRAVMAQQQAAWNAGSLEGFMEGYARTDRLRFASGGSVRTGWQTTLDAYQRGYPDRSAMGTLAFSGLDVQVLSAQHAVVFGRWRLQRAEDAGPEDGPGGLFTLLFEKRPEGWRVVHDHTSSE